MTCMHASLERLSVPSVCYRTLGFFSVLGVKEFPSALFVMFDQFLDQQLQSNFFGDVKPSPLTSYLHIVLHEL